MSREVEETADDPEVIVSDPEETVDGSTQADQPAGVTGSPTDESDA